MVEFGQKLQFSGECVPCVLGDVAGGFFDGDHCAVYECALEDQAMGTTAEFCLATPIVRCNSKFRLCVLSQGLSCLTPPTKRVCSQRPSWRFRPALHIANNSCTKTVAGYIRIYISVGYYHFQDGQDDDVD